ncbi:regulator of Vps4 activity in the MVB pathway-domain-containing protein [Aspergillus californicus]
MPPAPQTAKLTSTLHLLIPRLRLLQKKSTASSVVQRRELAQLLESHRDASARIRVENVIATDIGIEVMEMVELYCELLLARAGVLDGLAFGEAGQKARVRIREEVATQARARGGAAVGKEEKGGGGGFFGFFSSPKPKPSLPQSSATSTPDKDTETGLDGEFETYYLDPAIDEAAVVIFYAYQRFPTEVRELTILRSLLADRYGKDFMSLASENRLADMKVPERLLKGLRVRPPSPELVESYLKEIARAYKIPWGVESTDPGPPPGLDEDYEDGDGDGGDLALDNIHADQTVDLTRATPPRGNQISGKSPVSVAPPGPRSDNPNPRVKVPDSNNNNDNVDNDPAEPGSPSPSPAQRGKERNKNSSGIPEVDELSRRFAALKR